MANALKIIVMGYGVAAAAAVALAGVSLAALGLFWIGGAVATLAFAVAMAGRPTYARDDDEDAALGLALRRWEEDRAADERLAARSDSTRAG